MRFYKGHHQFYIGIDLHARTMYICVMNNEGSVLFHKNMATTPECLQNVILPYGTDIGICQHSCRIVL
jgi:hypothetical protein